MSRLNILGLLTNMFGVKPPVEKMDMPVRSGLGFNTNALQYKVWYNGEATSLIDFYKGLAGSDIDLGNMFWFASSRNTKIRKLHTGLPKLIVNKLTDITTSDLLDPVVSDNAQTNWESIKDVINLRKVLKGATRDVLVQGDGAFKISWDTELSPVPILEFYDALHTEFVYNKGFLVEIIYKDELNYGGVNYILRTHYGRGYITYSLCKLTLRGEETECSLSELPQTSDLMDIDLQPFGLGDTILGVQYIIKESSFNKGRGESIYHGKIGAFDSLDEVCSSWLDAVRSNRVQRLIPDSLIPRDPSTGQMLMPDIFNQYAVKKDNMNEGAENKAEVLQGEVDYTGYLSSYVTFLDMSLQGVISPSTLGIDVKKLDNAESQREKEKTTLYTRDDIITVLDEVLPQVIKCLLYAYDVMQGKSVKEYEASVVFGQYANPSFEALVETVGKARQFKIISLERAIEELYGSSLTDEEKVEEIERLRKEFEADNTSANGGQTQ